MELRNAVGAAFEMELPATVAFDYPTVAALSKYVAGRLPSQAAAASQPDAADGGWEEEGDVPQASRQRTRRSRRPRQQQQRPAAAAGTEAVAEAVSAAAAEVLGSTPSPDQPLMEVSQPNRACRPTGHLACLRDPAVPGSSTHHLLLALRLP